VKSGGSSINENDYIEKAGEGGEGGDDEVIKDDN
jgi:hypothetical protein